MIRLRFVPNPLAALFLAACRTAQSDRLLAPCDVRRHNPEPTTTHRDVVSARHLLFPFAIALLALLSAAVQAQRTDVEATNVYMAGPEVRPTGPIGGDLIAAAGRISLDHPVDGDAVLAAGSIDVRSRIGDDLRAAGGAVSLSGRVLGEALIAGGSIAFGPDAWVAGRAWLAGGEVAAAGRFDKGITIYARHILVLAQITGDVHLVAKTIEILPAAHIGGNVTYVSDTEIKVHPGARISGKIVRQPGTFPTLRLPGWPPFRPLLMAGLLAAGALLLALFPRFTASALRTVGASPLASLGLGTAIFFSVPPVIMLLIITIIGIPIALVLAGLYAAALLTGFLVAAFFVGERLLQVARRQTAAGYWMRVAALAVALLLLWLVRHVPYVGVFLILLALIIGLGAMLLQAFSSYAGRG